MSSVAQALYITARLMEMSELELKIAKTKTDNPKFLKILDDTLNTRFPKPPNPPK